MKKVTALLFVLVFCVSLCACQPTPDKPFVQSKNDGKLESAVYGSPAPEAVYSAPETWTENFSNNDESVVVNINATITVPDVTAYPVYRLNSSPMSDDNVANFIHGMIGDKKLYAVEGTTRTKDIIEAEIEKILAPYEDPDSDMHKALASGELSQEEYDYYLKLDNNKVAQLREEYKNAPAEMSYKEVDPSVFQASPLIDGISEIVGLVKNDDSSYGYVEVKTRNTSPYCLWQTKYFASNFDPSWYGATTITTPNKGAQAMGFWRDKTENLKGMELTYDEAKAFADEIVYDKLGRDNYDLARVFSENYEFIDVSAGWDEQYMFIYTPSVDGIPMLHYTTEFYEIMADGVNPNAYNPATYQHCLCVYVKDRDRYEVFEQAAFDIGDQLTSNTPLLSFDEIQDIFRRYILIDADSSNSYPKLDANGNRNILRETYNITDIRLGYVRIAEKNNGENGLLVPVWNFYGEETVNYSEYAYDVAEDQREEVLDTDPGNAFLCINAIDGSVINLDLGY